MSEHEMTFLDHLDEFRKRLIASAIALALGATICYIFFEPILNFIKWPLPHDLKSNQLAVLGFMQFFMIRFKLAIIGGFIFASPLVMYQILAFFAPALKRNEKKFVFMLLPFMILLFLSGVAFAFFIVLPNAILWLMDQGAGQLTFINKADDYINFVSVFLLAFGISFEAPLVVMSLVKLGIVERKQLRKNWRIAYVVSFIIAAMATPDWSIISMGVLGIVLVLLFELSLFLSRWL